MDNPPMIPPPQPDAADQDVRTTPVERIGSGVGRLISSGTSASVPQQGPSPLETMMAKHHAQRLAEAQMHQRNASDAAQQILSGQDLTQPAGPDGKHPPLTPEAKQKLYQQYQAALAAYKKIAGQNPESKKTIDQGAGVLDFHVNQAMQQGQNGQGAAPGAAPAAGGIQPPPQPGSATGAGGAGQSPSPKASSPASSTGKLTPPPQADDESFQVDPALAGMQNRRMTAQLDAEQAGQSEDARKLRTYKAEKEFEYEQKIKENAEKAKGKAAAAAAKPPRPAPGQYSTSVLDARTTGTVYKDFDGDPINLDKIPDSMGLKGALVFNPETSNWEVRYTTFSPNQASVTVGGETFAVSPMDKSKLARGAGTDLGAHNIPSTSSSTDPTSGLTTVTKRTPNITGLARRGTTGATAAAPRGGMTPPPQASAQPTQGSGSTLAKPAASSSAPPLSEDGHIASDWQGEAMPGVRATGSVIEAANQLIDDRDVDKIPPKVREVAAALARKTGWFQGKFTPKEQTLLKESTTFLQAAMDDPSLKALDAGYLERMKLARVLSNPDGKTNLFGEALTIGASKNLDSTQVQFAQMYNQLVGTISGLGQLVRSGRLTEATIERLKQELPNPLTTHDSKDARQRIQRLMKEVNVAMEKGQFKVAQPAAKGKLTPPPSADGSKAKSVDDEIMELVGGAKGKP